MALLDDSHKKRKKHQPQGGILSSSDRASLPKGAFAIPSKAPGSGSYPIPDISHARNALARSSGKPEEAAVKAAVYRRYPGLKP